MKEVFSQLHARIFIQDIQLQTCFKSVEACLIYQSLVRLSKYVAIEGNVLIRKSTPSQEYFERTLGISRYKVKKGISQLKKINIHGESLNEDNKIGFIPILEVKRRMGTSGIYILNTSFKKVEHVRPNEKSNMNDQRKVQHVEPITNIEQTIEQTIEQYDSFEFLFEE